MIKTFTRTDLIRFVYKETSKEEEKEIKKALLVDDELMEEFKNLRKIVKDIDGIECEPSNETIKKILSYSKALNLHSVKP